MSEHIHLEGSAVGLNQKSLIEDAVDESELFFGTRCVAVKLENIKVLPPKERSESVRYIGEFAAMESHELTSPAAFGPSTCRDCGKSSYPSSPLPTPRWT